MKKHSFLEELQQRASEQHVVMHDVPFPKVFLFISRVFGEYPWKFFIPAAVVSTLLLHFFIGRSFDERILWLFGAL